PAIQQQVVSGPDNLIGIARLLNHGNPHQWRIRKVKTTTLIFLEERIHPVLQFSSRQTPPIMLFEGHLDPALHHLQRVIKSFPKERRPQDRMAVNHALPGALISRELEVAVRGEHRLFEIDSGIRRIQRVKKYALL